MLQGVRLDLDGQPASRGTRSAMFDKYFPESPLVVYKVKISGIFFVGKDQNTRVELFCGFSGKNIVILPSPINFFC